MLYSAFGPRSDCVHLRDIGCLKTDQHSDHAEEAE
jgi:hypothetical protein